MFFSIQKRVVSPLIIKYLYIKDFRQPTMSNTLLIFICILFGALLGALIGYFFSLLKSKSKTGTLNQQIAQTQQQIETYKAQLSKIEIKANTLQEEKETLQKENTRAEATIDHLKDNLQNQKEELEKIQEKFNKEFELLARKILDTKSEKFTKQNKENIDSILKPLQEKIEKFEKRVENTNKESIERNTRLREQIVQLTKLNEQMSKEATNLTKALKGDSKLQGNWGELVLERVLEKSGLEKDREYFVQNSFTTDDGKRVLPDVVLHLPDNKKLIIDSKVSLVAYERYVNEEDNERKKQFLKEHISSIKKHIDQLSEKSYHDLYDIDSPDFVLLFIPIEPAFAIALKGEENLYNWAFDKNIVIVTPTTLLATLRTVDSMWKNEKQQQNAIEIARQAGALYDSFTNLTNDLIKVGNQLGTVQGSYESTMKKLTGRGNLITRVERIKKLGAKASKQIDEKLLKRAEEDTI